MGSTAEHEQARAVPASRGWFHLLLALAGVAVCAIPFIGWILGVIGGFAMISVTRREKRWARLHVSELPVTPIAELAAGSLARLHGRVVSAAVATGPISRKPVAYAGITGKRSVRRGVGEILLDPRHLGEEIELEDGTGRARIPLRHLHLLSRHVTAHVEHNDGPLPALRALYPDLPASQRLEVEEAAIEPGDELWIVGRIESVEALASDHPGRDYRAGAARRVGVGSRAGEWLRVSSVTPEELGRVIKTSPAFLAVALVWLTAAAAGLGYWGWRFFR
jgi:hypothetical protein